MKTIAIILPNITNRAGTERAVSNLANILCNQGHCVYIFSIASETGYCPYKLNDSITILHLNLPYKKHSLFFGVMHYFNIFKELKKYAESLDLDLIIGTYQLINFIIPHVYRKIKTIGCEHFNYEASGKVKNFLKRYFYKKLTKVVLLTERDRKKYSFCNNTCVIPNSLSYKSGNLSLCTNKKMISLGRLNFQKGYDILIESIALIKNELKDWKVIIYGSGEDKELLIQLRNEYGLSTILEIQEPVKNVEEVYVDSSIYLLSSRFEGLPMVLLEAQSCGLPAVVFDCPCGPAEIVEDGRTGFVVALGNKELFAKKILELVENENLRKEFGKKAAVEANRYSTENVAKAWEKLLTEIFMETEK